MQYRIESEGLDKFFNQGVDLANQTKYQEALSNFEKSLKKNPKHIPTYRNIAYLHLSLNQYDQLIKSMDKAIKSGINDSGIWHYKGYALKLLNKIDEAIESLSNSLKCDPEKAIELREQYTEVTGAYHFNKTHWNGVDLNGSITDRQLKEWIDHSYELVVKSLPKSKQKRL